MGLRKCLSEMASRSTRCLERVFETYGSFTYKYPWLIILVSLTVFACLAYGFTLHEEELDIVKLWAPKNTQVLNDIEKIEEAFNLDFKIEYIYVVAKPEGANLLTADAFQELMQFELGVWESVEYNGRKYNDLCVKSSSESNESACSTSNYPLQFFLTQDATFDESMLTNLVAEINDGKGTTDFYQPDSFNYISIDKMFGGTTPASATTNQTDGTNSIQEAKAIHWIFYVDSSQVSAEFLIEFEKAYEDYVHDFNEKSTYISVHPILNSSMKRESDEAIANDVQLITIGFGFIVAFSVYVLGELNTYRSRMLIAIVGIVSITLAYVEAIGLGSYLSIKGNAYVSVVPFLMVGIGVDDMYVLISALKQGPRGSSGEQMMRYMMKHAGVSITITSITNIGAFGIGGITTIPAVRNFCAYAAFGMLFDYFNQMTVFSALLAYDIRRSEKPLGDWCGLVFCKPDSKACCDGRFIFDEHGKTQEALSQRFIYKKYSKCLMKTPVRIVVCVAFAVFLGTNIYSATQLRVAFDYEWLVNEDFTVHTSMEIRDKYFESLGDILSFYSLYSDFPSYEVQAQLEEFTNNIQNCKDCKEGWILDNSVDSWYASYKTWVSQENCIDSEGEVVSLNDGFIPPNAFHECLEQFESTTEGFFYSTLLAWEDGVLIGAVVEADLILVEETPDKLQVLEDIRNIAESGPDDTYVFNKEFLRYEHLAVLERETTIQLGSALALVLVTIFVANADILLALLVLLMVTFTLVGQLGTITFWGEHINVLSMTNAIMAIGVALDYSAHMAYVFKCSSETNKVKKSRQSLRTIGVGIFNGGLSTLLAILPLVMAKSYALTMFFKCWLSSILYGLGHSLILLPVLLSFIGVTGYMKVEGESKDRTSAQAEKSSERQCSESPNP